MKTALIPLAFLSFSLAQLSAIEVPKGMLALIANPPSISKDRLNERSFTFKNKSAIVEGEDFIAYLELASEADVSASTYRFRSYSKQFKLEISGEGRVFERYYRIKDPSGKASASRTIDRGSKLVIDAGLFKVRWSSGNHIYIGKGFTAKPGSEEDYLAKIKG